MSDRAFAAYLAAAMVFGFVVGVALATHCMRHYIRVKAPLRSPAAPPPERAP